MQPYNNYPESYQEAARIIHDCNAILITAGAGLGVDSGLPDFRGTEGFWQAYPVFRQKGLDFFDLANPRWFKDDPQQAWGFYGHRHNLYRATTPHKGFKILLDWVQKLDHNYFVFTSNVDGHFQKTGFSTERIHECHGSFEFLQCSDACTTQIWSAETTHLQIDEETLIANQPIPKCPVCDAPARPNILMFGTPVSFQITIKPKTKNTKLGFQIFPPKQKSQSLKLVPVRSSLRSEPNQKKLPASLTNPWSELTRVTAVAPSPASLLLMAACKVYVKSRMSCDSSKSKTQCMIASKNYKLLFS